LSLAELKGSKSRRLGTDAGSIADYRLRQRGFLRRLFRTQLSVLKSLDDGGIDYAYVWANAGWIMHTTPEFELELAADYVPEDHWNIAIAIRHGDIDLKRHVDAAIKKLSDEGTVAAALADYHVPYFRPFGRPDEKDDLSQAIQHGPTDRGLEPQMYRRRRSKKRYVGLERLRSAGELVVGLDHNNLPLSTVHPVPAGLDYEIAELLAEKLGVSLRVYWAYSSHDSYPSKLATKRFCDVMLGVMPDDRFAQRVLYSKPYYHATYQLIARAGADQSAAAAGPLAVVRGAVLRGIGEREAREYANLEAILLAVVNNEEQTGIVISTRGPWLAEQHWPGRVKLLGELQSSDRFPICAAVRKEDTGLKNAIDQAFAELADTGELARVFANWQVPYTTPRKSAQLPQ
jgi:ABC-type amino acid transport substrate-binding protein